MVWRDRNCMVDCSTQCGWGPPGRESKAFFFEKKKQKAFISAVADLSGERATAESKVFWFFFAKKNRFERCKHSLEPPPLLQPLPVNRPAHLL